MATFVLVTVVVILSAAVVLMAAGLVEVYAELAQVRTVLRLQDQPSRLHLPTLGRELSELLTEAPPELQTDQLAPENFVLVLSNSCSVCHSIGADLAHTKPAWATDLTVIVASESEQAGQEFVSDLGLGWPRLLIDQLGVHSKQLGVETSPMVLKVLNGRLDSAANLSSLRQLELFVGGRMD